MKQHILILFLLCLSLSACQTTQPEPELVVPADIVAVHEEINAYQYIRETEGGDYWKQPSEFYADKGGDCEDYAIAKYHLLKHHHEVALLLGTTWETSEGHAVLLVDNKYVLDNASMEIYSVEKFRETFAILAAVDPDRYMKCIPTVPETCVTVTVEALKRIGFIK